MPCLLLIVILFFPRLVLGLLWLLTNYLNPAFHGNFLLLVAGFFFLPVTTLVYAWEIHNGMPTAGINLLWLILAVIVDLGGLGGGARHRRRE